MSFPDEWKGVIETSKKFIEDGLKTVPPAAFYWPVEGAEDAGSIHLDVLPEETWNPIFEAIVGSGRAGSILVVGSILVFESDPLVKSLTEDGEEMLAEVRGKGKAIAYMFACPGQYQMWVLPYSDGPVIFGDIIEVESPGVFPPLRGVFDG